MPWSSSKRQYAWRRYWTAPGQNIDDGFFPDESSWIFARSTESYHLAHLVEDPCLVLLGEPGLGKSHAIDDAVAQMRRTGHLVHTVDLGAYDDGPSLIGAIVSSPTWRLWRESDEPLLLFLDGLDEALLHVKAIHKRLIAGVPPLWWTSNG